MIKFQENAWRSIQHPQFLSKSHPSLVPFKIPRSGQPKMLDSSLQTRVSEPVAKMSDTSSFTSLCVYFSLFYADNSNFMVYFDKSTIYKGMFKTLGNHCLLVTPYTFSFSFSARH